jgi:hypothetical protein
LATYHEDGVWEPTKQKRLGRRKAPAPYSGQPVMTSEMAPLEAGAKAKFGVLNADVNRKEDISKAQMDELDALLREFSEIFEDRGTVAIEPQEDWMRIQLKDGADLQLK